MDMEHCKATA